MLSLLIFGTLFLLIGFTRIPLGLAMLITGAAGISVLHPRGLSAALAVSEQQVMNLAFNYQFSVLPLFILMGVFIVRAGMANDLFTMAKRWTGQLPGGVGVATIVACGGFAAMCASSAAAAATMAKIAIPELEKSKYDPGFAAGSVAAGGTMGVLIPPSGALIIYGLLTETSVGELFVAGIIPGLLQVLVYVVVMILVARFLPHWAPKGPSYTMAERVQSIGPIWGVVVLFLLIMVGLSRGWFTATEAGGIGAGGAFLFVVIRRKLTREVFTSSLIETARISTMIFIVAAGAMVLNQFINLSGISGRAIEFIQSLNMAPMMVVLMLVLFYLALGCLMDGFAMIFLTVPIVAPIIAGLGYDLVWWAIVTVVVVEISMITPPVGLNVFVLRAMLPKVPVMQIFKGVTPFIISDFLRVALILAFPALALWLPAFVK